MLKGYEKPKSLEEAQSSLTIHCGEALIVAGATDVFLDIKKGRKSPQWLVDIRGIPELRTIRKANDSLFIGAAATHREIACHPLIQRLFPALAQGALAVGAPQIRHVGTVGGNVINAQPAADTAIPLFSYAAKAEYLDESGQRVVKPIDDLYIRPGVSALDSGRCILIGFHLPCEWVTSSIYLRFAKRKALALPIVNLAVALRIIDGVITDAKLTAGPMAGIPLRLRSAEAALIGNQPGPELYAAAAAAASREAQPRDSVLRGSASYRQELLSSLMIRGLQQCC